LAHPSVLTLRIGTRRDGWRGPPVSIRPGARLLAELESTVIVSNMENTDDGSSRREAASALRDAELSRTTLARAIAAPPSLFASLGAAVAIQIATAAIGLGGGHIWISVSGVALLAVVAGVQLMRFARHNGVWIRGFVSRVVLGTGTGASLAYAVPLAAAIWAGYGARWWLVPPLLNS
jgi:hypothetical protein